MTWKITRCKTANEMWNKLEVTYEGTSQVKDSKIDLLTHEYELFMMMENETIDGMFKRFSTIVSTLDTLGKQYEDHVLVRKILRSLTPEWKSMVNPIKEGRDYNTLTYDALRERFRAKNWSFGKHLYSPSLVKNVSAQTFTKRSDNAATATAAPRRTAPAASPAEPQARANLASIADSLNRLHFKVDGMEGYLERLDVAIQRQGHAMNAYFQGINYVPPPFHGPFLGEVYGDEDEEDGFYS
ncbi:unnamed protein product [Cuscuta campestris]|uniref:UBN2 domain-containing protein n=1 Tax=Cuscuta campestris TaxID=132261 RepID=A0A484N0A1_9ASTE|nr:unnamed protein product [Cuscuta campestris]